VRSALPRGFIEPWDAWVRAALLAGRERLGEKWTAAWMEAPVWRFALAPEVCGPQAVLGVWLPSVDRAGRHFPLTLARLGHSLGELALDGAAFLAAAERAGCAAIADDMTPDALAAALAQPGEATDLPALPEAGALWWTAGAPRRSAVMLTLPGLPDAAAFAAMLDESCAP
jgi:type VI secretion system protein ImpM